MGTPPSAGGEFERDASYITTRITVDGVDGYPIEAGRYRLVVARACPWANRVMIVRRLLGLESVMSQAIAGPLHGPESWNFEEEPGGVDQVLGINALRDAYETRSPGYPKGITVPAIVDVATGAVATNDFAQMTLDLASEWTTYHRPGAPDLYPDALRNEMDELMEQIYQDVNNGVYRAGFATDQGAYQEAYSALFSRLDQLSQRLERQRFLMGETITEADVRLWPTLVRFDAVYHGHFKCNRQKLTEMPVLWAYARDLFQTPGFGDTIDFAKTKEHYYGVHRSVNPSGIVPVGPDVSNWMSQHDREELGGRPFGQGTPPGPPPEGE